MVCEQGRYHGAKLFQQLLSNINASLFFVEIEQFWYEYSGDQFLAKSLVKIEWHGLIDMFFSNRDSMISQWSLVDLGHIFSALR